MSTRASSLVVILMLSLSLPAAAVDFIAFETGPVRPLAMSEDKSQLYATNIPDNQLQIYRLTNVGIGLEATVQVGMEPCAAAVAPDGRVWVVNHLSDSVSIVDVNASPPQVVQTLLVGDEPRDIVFAGSPTRAFITTAHRGQHRSHSSISGITGAGDPQLTIEGIGRADVWVFNAANPGADLGGVPDEILSLFTDTPRALAVSSDESTVYVAGFYSGNQTTSIPELLVCDGFNPGVSCLDPIQGVLTLPGGLDGPSDNVFGANAPETGLIVRFNNANSRWEDSAGTDWSSIVNFDLPDRDVFAINANTLNTSATYTHVGTTLFNMVANPVSGKVYVSNIEAPSHVNFEGPGDHGGSTVQGRLSESRISVLSGASTVDPIHLNKHIEYDKLHTDVPDLVNTDDKNHSLATPLQMVVSSDGSKLYVAAFGSAKIGVFDTSSLEADSFVPENQSSQYISTGGGPSGLVLDEARNRIYVLTRFDNSVSVINRSTGATLQTVALHDPEPPSVAEGRPFLYDALNTSGNGEASCSSCHIFGDMDHIAWNLGNPDDGVTVNNQPSVIGGQNSFHPMKGPMTTQTLRGLATSGAMHWRGDRLDGFFGTDDCLEPSGAPCNEEHSFNNFIVAFEGLIGKDGILDTGDMQKFTDFALKLTLPPNPVRALDNSLTAAQDAGSTLFTRNNMDGGNSCEDCHRLSPGDGFFGTGGFQSFEGEPQNFKIPHLRNMYAKVGMFGMLVAPNGTPQSHTGEQVRGFGVLHDGSVDTVGHFVGSPLFNANTAEELQMEQFMLAFDSDLAPIVGQQVTLDSSNATEVNPRIDVMIDRADTPFTSAILGPNVSECDLIVKGTVDSEPRGWFYANTLPLNSLNDFQDDTGASISDVALRALAASEGPLTYTCVPPGSGMRMGINRDGDGLPDGLDNCDDVASPDQTNTDGDAMGDLCDPDDDNDELFDQHETATGVFVSETNTGTDPLLADTDGDGYLDGAEVAAGSDPNDQASIPPGQIAIPTLPRGGFALLALAIIAVAAGFIHRQRSETPV